MRLASTDALKTSLENGLRLIHMYMLALFMIIGYAVVLNILCDKSFR